MLTTFTFLFDCLLLVTSRCLSTWQACVCLHQWTIGLLNCRCLGLHFSGNETEVHWIHRATLSHLQCWCPSATHGHSSSLSGPSQPSFSYGKPGVAVTDSPRFKAAQYLRTCHTSSAEFRTVCHVPQRANARNVATIDGKQNRRWRRWER